MSRDSITKVIIDFFLKLGIEPVYVASLVGLLICLSYSKDIKRWTEVEDWKKIIIILSFVGTVIVFVISILFLLKVISR